MRESTYSHNEQIKHNTDTTAPLGAWRINSSELPGLICIAALRRENSTRCRLGFPCECINSLSPCQPSFGFDTNHQGEIGWRLQQTISAPSPALAVGRRRW